MATYWGYTCKDCYENTKTDIRNGDREELTWFFHFRNIIGKLWDEKRAFLDKHKGHNVAMFSEYGETQPITPLDTM